MSGAWFASTPIEPVVVRVDTISTSSSKTFPSGVRTSTGNLFLAIVLAVAAVVALALALALALGPARGLRDLVDRALEQEGSLGDVVVLALDDLREGPHGVLDLHELPGRAGELLGHEERLRQETLHLAGALHGQLVLVRELVDSEDGDDVLQLLVALQDLAHLVRDPEVLLPHDVRLQDRGGGVERIDGRVDPLLRDR